MGTPLSSDSLENSFPLDVTSSIETTTGQTELNTSNPVTYFAAVCVAKGISHDTQEVVENMLKDAQNTAQIQSDNLKEDIIRDDILRAIRKLDDRNSEKQKLLTIFSKPDFFPYASVDSVESMN